MSYGRFKIGETAERLGVTKRTISHYVEKGIIIPEQLPERPGMLNRFGERNFYEVLLIQELAKNGFDLETIKNILQRQSSKWKIIGPGNELMVIYDGHTDHGSVTFTAAKKDGTYLVKMKGRKSATVIDISDLRNKAAKLAR